MGENNCPKPQVKPSRTVSRREFLKLATLTAGLVASGCTPRWLREAGASTPTPLSPAVRSTVALAQATSYDRKLIKQKVQSVVDGAGGLAGVIRPGARVALKVNLTGGLHFSPPQGFSAPESYVTHPEVVRAMGELLRDAGAKEIFIVEGLYDQESSPAWGYEQLARELDAELIDLNSPQPYSDFIKTPTGSGWLAYEYFWLNPILQEVDALVSVAKMKCHYQCGITLSMKNLVGLAPVSRYRLDGEHWWRSAFHGSEDETKTRLPKVIVDLNRAVPIDFALIDGIMTAEGGESPRGSFNPVQPGILAAGANPVAVDAVVTAAMGFDPLAEPPDLPFLRSDNYLSLACGLGMGSNRLADVEVVGPSLEDIETHFGPAWEM
ncbi:MAG: DUF362 domain-containing protein [Chloroflexota bacterium]|nr:MAG: DUF362 domain-containing protein [Chloroflexota bacterium]